MLELKATFQIKPVRSGKLVKGNGSSNEEVSSGRWVGQGLGSEEGRRVFLVAGLPKVTAICRDQSKPQGKGENSGLVGL